MSGPQNATLELAVRCHSCALITEIYAEAEDANEYGRYVVPKGKTFSCGWCGREHTEGYGLEVVR